MSDDFEVARYGLRTFKIADGKLQPVAQGRADDWLGGTCTADCHAMKYNQHHKPPVKECGCGVYAALTAFDLIDQWMRHSALVIAVVAAEGTTIIGPRGFRTECARVVAWWSPYWNVRRLINKQFPNTVRYKRLQSMLDAYHLPFYPPSRADDPEEEPFWA